MLFRFNSASIKFKQGLLLGTFSVAVVLMLTMTIIKLFQISDSFEQYDEGGVAVEVGLLRIAKETNYISRLTRSIMLGDDYGKNMKAFDERVVTITRHFSEIKQASASIRDETRRRRLLELIETAHVNSNSFIDDGHKRMAALKEADEAGKVAAWADYHQHATPLAVKARESFKALVAYSGEIKKATNEEARDAIHALLIFLPVGASVTLLFTIGLGYVIIRDLLRQLGGEPREIVVVARRIAAGDLSGEAADSRSATGLLAVMYVMQAELRGAIGRVVSGAHELNSASFRLHEVSGSVAAGAHAQSDAASAMAAAIEEMTASIHSVAENSAETYRIARKAGEMSAEGGNIVNTANAEMGEIVDSVEQSAQLIQTLGEHSQQISLIANVIKDIADQTNLLALNAAIEAARAGEHGRGFAVVADEVRKLAERTTKSTQEISDMINSIQQGTDRAVASMKEGTEKVHQGVAMISRAGDSMREIRAGAGQVENSVSEINAALQEQSQSSQEVAVNVEKISRMVEKTSNEMRVITDTSRQLDMLAVSLKESVSHFRLS